MAIKVIRDATGDYQRWEAPHVDSSDASSVMSLLTAEQVSGIQDDAFKEAHEQGYKEGYKQGSEKAQKEQAQKSQELQKRVDQMDHLLRALNAPFEQLDEQVERELVTLAAAIARQIIRREIKTDPGQIVAVVREVVALLPGSTRHPQIFLHPEDASFVRQTFSISGESETWKLVDDPTLTRGDCRVVTDQSRVDATLENRLAAIVANTLGGEREEDR